MANALNRFGSFCRDARAKHGKTMAAQSDALGQDVTEISAIETGRVLPSEDYVRRFCDWLDVAPVQRAEFAKRVPHTTNVIVFPRNGNTSSTIRLFRKISKMTPTEIRALAKGANKGVPDD